MESIYRLSPGKRTGKNGRARKTAKNRVKILEDMSEPKNKPSFKELLEKEHRWPCVYTFKFIVPKENRHQVEALFPDHKISVKNSSEGAYVSLTVGVHVDSADLVIAIYEQASFIEGLIAL